MSDEATFATDLYQGKGGYYDQFRLPYPDTLIADLVARTGSGGSGPDGPVGPAGPGRLLDLACGTGQLAFALRPWFAEVWAVDQEPDMIGVVAAKGADPADASAGRVRPVVASAEELDAPAGWFSVAVIGNAFHRLPRDLVARRVHGWLQPGGFLALCWSLGTQSGPRDWQAAFGDLLRRWQSALGGEDRIPADWDRARRERPDPSVLSEAGFEVIGRPEFAVEHRWTAPELAGFARTLSFLPTAALAEHAAAFDQSLAAALAPYAEDGHLTETVSFSYDLARKPVAPWPLPAMWR